MRLIRPTFYKEVEGPPKFLMLLSLHATLSDPGSPSESHHNDSPVLASGTLTPSPTASVAANGAESLRGGTSPLRPAMFSVYASPVLFAPDHPGLRNRRNTRYGLLVKLYPMGTYTPKEAPSCAWRTSDVTQGAELYKDKRKQNLCKTSFTL